MAVANTCNNIWPFLVCLRSRIAKKFKWSLCSLICVGLGILLWLMNEDHSVLTVKLVTGLDEWTCSTSRFKIRSKSLQHSSTRTIPCQHKANWWLFSFRYWQADVWASNARNLGKAHRSIFFVWQFSIETFLFNAHQPAEAPFTSQGSQDLVKLLPIWGSFVSLSDPNFKYKWQFIMPISRQMFFKSSVSKWCETDGNQQNLCFCLQVQ